MANNELKPCPFCGRHNKIYSFADGGGNTLYSINCGTIACPARSSFAAGTAEDVATAWNLRAAPAQAEPSDALPEKWEERCKAALAPGLFEALGDSVMAIAERYMHAEIMDLRAYAKQAIEARGALSDEQIEDIMLPLMDNVGRVKMLAFARAIESRILGQQGGGDAWISVEDRLPEWAARDDTHCVIEGKVVPPTLTSQTVLVAIAPHNGVRIDKLTAIEGGEPWFDAYKRRVTHWMPLPPPPAIQAQAGDATQGGGDV